MKKTLALVLALVVALCAMTISAFALSYDFEDGSVGGWTTHGGPGNLSVRDGMLLTSGRWNGAFMTAHDLGALSAGKTYTVSLDVFANASDLDIDGAITYTVRVIDYSSTGVLDGGSMDNGVTIAVSDYVVTSGELTAIDLQFTPEADIEYAMVAINTIQHDPWARSPEFFIDNVALAEGAAVVEDTPVDEPAVEDTPADEPVVEDTPADEPTVEEPAETGLVFAVVPAVIALAVVAFKER